MIGTSIVKLFFLFWVSHGLAEGQGKKKNFTGTESLRFFLYPRSLNWEP